MPGLSMGFILVVGGAVVPDFGEVVFWGRVFLLQMTTYLGRELFWEDGFWVWCVGWTCSV